MPSLPVSEMKILSWHQKPEPSQPFPPSYKTQSKAQREQAEHAARQPQKSPAIVPAERTLPGGRKTGEHCVKTHTGRSCQAACQHGAQELIAHGEFFFS